MKTTNARTTMTAEQRIISRQQRAQRHAKQRQQEEEMMREVMDEVNESMGDYHAEG